MNIGLYLQYAVIAVLVCASVLSVLRMLAPRLSARGRAAAGAALNQPGRPAMARMLGRRLQARKLPAGGCSDGCSTCGSCAPAEPARASSETQPLRFQRRAK